MASPGVGNSALYDPRWEHDACGIGFVANLHEPSHQIIRDGIHILERLTHRGAAGSDPESGDGAGILMQMPDAFMRKVADEAGFGVRAGSSKRPLTPLSPRMSLYVAPPRVNVPR